MLVNARLHLQFLFYALQTACYIHAHLPHSGLISPTGQMLSPYARQKGVPPRISQIRVFGCPLIYQMHKTLKWETSGRRGVHIGPTLIWQATTYTTQFWDKPRGAKIYYLLNHSKARSHIKYLRKPKTVIYFVISNFMVVRWIYTP